MGSLLLLGMQNGIDLLGLNSQVVVTHLTQVFSMSFANYIYFAN